jgi:hypothetical protein
MPVVRTVHSAVPGRARLAVAGLYRDDALAKALEGQLRRRSGILSASASALTGKVLVVFDSSLDLEQVSKLVALSLGICGLVFALGLLRGYGVLPMIRSSISLAIAAVPEGPPSVATTTLALGIGAMRRRKVLIRQMRADETLGALQVICLDKTGTITFNRMRAVSVANGANGHSDPADLPILLKVGVLCSYAAIEEADGAYVVKARRPKLRSCRSRPSMGWMCAGLAPGVPARQDRVPRRAQAIHGDHASVG